jgi:GNAT superfamily N-acetyltransferase
MNIEQNFQIRKAIDNDLQVIVNFQLKMAWETEQIKLDESVLKKGVESLLRNPERGYYWVVEENKVPVACMLILYEWSDWRNGNVLWVHSLYVAESHRRKGVFKMLYSRLKDMVSNHPSWKGIRLYVEKSNHFAKKAYEEVGLKSDHYEMFEWLK